MLFRCICVRCDSRGKWNSEEKCHGYFFFFQLYSVPQTGSLPEQRPSGRRLESCLGSVAVWCVRPPGPRMGETEDGNSVAFLPGAEPPRAPALGSRPPPPVAEPVGVLQGTWLTQRGHPHVLSRQQIDCPCFLCLFFMRSQVGGVSAEGPHPMLLE